MRVVLVLMTLAALISGAFSVIEYSDVTSQANATILQQIAALLWVGAALICLMIGVAGLAIIEVITNITETTTSKTPSKARWWQDKNNPGKE